MFKSAGSTLTRRMRQLAAAQDVVGKARVAISDILPERQHLAFISSIEYADGTLTVHTTSKSLAAFLLMQTGQLGSVLRADGVRVSRIVVH